ncbi:MAG TPA: ABC transporter ATP-binding protein [Stellaceae bacterium]|jgi:NitT/TauT family transport system ATP-binding protein|nr:ABC transporter ATP-binding protein [Stellaceae bacterium]
MGDVPVSGYGATLSESFRRDRAPAERADAIIDFNGVSVELTGEQIYDALTFQVLRGEFLCILGPSGCGKSTCLRLIGGLLPASQGRVEVDGCTPSQAWDQIAYVFQAPRLVPWRTALGNVLLAMELRFGGSGKHEREERCRALLDLVGLAKDADKFPRMLSGGERQRVAIARALAVDPKIILMDEPFAALDLNTRRRLRTEVVGIWEKTGKTIVFVTHDIDEALVLADRVILMSNKPTRAIETIAIKHARPRNIDTTAELRADRDRLHRLFRELEPDAENTANPEPAGAK